MDGPAFEFQIWAVRRLELLCNEQRNWTRKQMIQRNNVRKAKMSNERSRVIVTAILLLIAFLIWPSTICGMTLPIQASEAKESQISFEVISIKKSGSEFPSGQTFTDDGFSVQGFPAFFLISLAYDFKDFDRLRGLSRWCFSEKYDIQAKVATPDISTWKMLSSSMKARALQILLADRFGLRLHEEYREGSVYELVIAKTGLKAKRAIQQDSAPIEKASVQITMNRSLTMDQLASALPNLGVSRPVVNKTGLQGHYDCSLRVVDDDSSLLRPSDPSIRDELRDQLGLDLRPATDQVKMMVIDHIERPSGN